MMAAVARQIRVHVPEVADSSLVTRVLDCVEVLYQRIEMAGLGAIDDIDRYHTPFVVKVSATRDLGQVRQLIKRQLQHHGLEEIAVVET